MGVFTIATRPTTRDLIDFRSSTLTVKSSNNNIRSSQLQIDLNNIQ